MKKKEQYYHSKEWKATRALVIERDERCVNCRCFGREQDLDETLTVHHIIKFYEQMNEKSRMICLTDPRNCICLCDTCHHEMHRRDNCMIHPVIRDYVYQMKCFMTAVYVDEGIIWTNDATR